MARTEPVVFLAFADDPQDHLALLIQELNGIRADLNGLHTAGCIEIDLRYQISLNQIHTSTADLEDRICVFHYGGHAGSQQLRLAGGEAHIAGLARLLKDIDLVFLNGCATKDQVQILLENGVKAVIATRSEIGDKKAFDFATAFYRDLSKGKDLQEAFERACSIVKSNASLSDAERQQMRAIEVGDMAILTPLAENEISWKLFVHAREAYAWKLPGAQEEESLPGLPDDDIGTQVEARLVQLNYEAHRNLLLDYVLDSTFHAGAFVVHGPAQHGQTWLSTNVLESLIGRDQLELDSRIIEFGENVETVKGFLKELKKWLNLTPPFVGADLASEVKQIGEAFAQKLQTQTVLIRIKDTARLLELPDFVNQFMQEFWKPFIAQLAAQRQAQPGVRFQKMFMLMVYSRQPLRTQHACLCDLAQVDFVEDKFCLLPDIAPIDEPSIRDWLRQESRQYQANERIVNDRLGDRLRSPDFWTTHQGMAPISFMEQILWEGFQLQFIQEPNWRWRLSSA